MVLGSKLAILVGGALLLSVVHAAIPNHWLPFVILQREQDWSRPKLLYVTGLSAFAHVASTVLIGVVIGLAGTALARQFEVLLEWVGPAILVGLGLWLVFSRRHHQHDEHSRPTPYRHHSDDEGHQNRSHSEPRQPDGIRRGNVVTVGGLVLMMFFSPCLELEAYYLPAAQQGWPGILAVSAVFLTVTVGLMLLFVWLASAGISRLHWTFLERHDCLINGSILIALGVLWKLLPF